MARKKRTRGKRKYLKNIDEAHNFDHCDFCQYAQPSIIKHVPVHIRSSEGTEIYWVCEICLQKCYSVARKDKRELQERARKEQKAMAMRGKKGKESNPMPKKKKKRRASNRKRMGKKNKK